MRRFEYSGSYARQRSSRERRGFGALPRLEQLEPRLVLDSTVVFNEVMYNPSGEGNGQQEWVELFNQLAVDVDLSEWTLGDGVSFEFPEGTTIGGGQYLIVASDPENFTQQTDVAALGPLQRRLSNAGETIELRDNSQRLMDYLPYDDDGNWPVVADGSGASLAKADPMSGSRLVENWGHSGRVGGTPGSENFPALGGIVRRTQLIEFGSGWSFHDSGTDLDDSWRELNFDDQSWGVGEAPFTSHRENSDYRKAESIVTLFNTGLADDGSPLSPGDADPHWFDTATNEPMTAMLNDPAWLSNDASGTWIGTRGTGVTNVPAGDYSFSTQFDLSAYEFETVSIAALVAVDDGMQDIVLNGQSLGINSSGFSDFNGPFPLNSGLLPGMNTIEVRFFNGGTSSNPSGLRVKFDATAIPLEDNTPLSDETTTYYLRREFEFAPASDVETVLTLDAIVDDGAMFYLNGVEVHRQNLPAVEKSPADLVRGVQLSTEALSSGANILAVEVHKANGLLDDMEFDAALAVAETPISPALSPKIRINELPAADEAVWVELINDGQESVDLAGVTIATSAVDEGFTFPTTTLESGAIIVVDAVQLGFAPEEGQRIFVYGPGRSFVMDGQRLSDRLQGRSADHDGRWLYPSEATPGLANQFEIETEIVINEIQYHARPQLAEAEIPPRLKFSQFVGFDSTWIYDQTRRRRPTDWHLETFAVDDRTWFEGEGPFGYERGAAAAMIRTQLDNPRTRNPRVTAFYFQTQFEYDGGQSEDSFLHLNHLVDDGAVFYLNGTEVGRFNLDEGPVNHSTLASRSVGDASREGPIELSIDHLNVGNNVFSAVMYQSSSSSSDMVFAAELSIVDVVEDAIPPVPYVESDEEWIELHNRGNKVVDVGGWTLDDAIQYEIPRGTTIDPGGYLVLANDVDQLRQRHPGLQQVLGPFAGQLANGSDRIVLRDQEGNPTDEVTYYDGGVWSGLADGQGSTLELRDPRSDNRNAQAWSASDESEKTSWQHISYRGSAGDFPGSNDPSRWNEFIFGLLGVGEILIDDVSLVGDPDGQAIQFVENGTFDLGVDGFRLLGTHGIHGLSRVVPDPDDPGNPVLHLVSTGSTEHMSNHVETTFVDDQTMTSAFLYEVSYRAKWINGSGQIHTRSYFNQMPSTRVLDVPESSGTPGRRNSSYVLNAGPTYENLRHYPVLPLPGESVRVSIHAADADGIQQARLWYSVDEQEWQQVAMTVVEGEYVAEIPSQLAGATVQFYVEATDGLGAESFFPARGPGSRAMYKVEDGSTPDLKNVNFHVIMKDSDLDLMKINSNVMSNHRFGATLITDGDTIYYDVGLRLKGSGYGRANIYVGYNIRFSPDDLFRDVHDIIAVDRKDNQFGQGASHREAVLKHIAIAAGDVPAMYDEMIYILPPDDSFTGPAQLIMARYDKEFLDASYENGSDGTRFKMELIYYRQRGSGDPELPKGSPNTVLGSDIRYRGENQEAYRWNFLIKNQRMRDDYSGIIRMAEAFANNDTSNGGTLDVLSQAAIDVDQWLRNFAYEALGGINDTYHQGLPHNIQFFVRPEDQRVVALPWDQDFAFHHGPTMGVFGVGSLFSRVQRIPDNRHRYLSHMHDMLSTTYNQEYLGPWIDHYAEFMRLDLSDEIKKYIQDRADHIYSRLPDSVDFKVDAEGSIQVDDTVVTLTGSGWVDVADIRLQGTVQPLDVTWTSETTWEMELGVPAGVTDFHFEGVNLQGVVVATDALQITSAVTERPVEKSLRVAEVMYHPSGPNARERQLGFGDADEFEFIELVNIGSESISLEEVHLDTIEFEDGEQGVTFDFVDGRVRDLNPGERVLVVENRAAFEARYGTDLPVAGQWIGQLSNAGETLTLAIGPRVIQQFRYDDDWYADTDGGGPSLQVVDLHEADLSRWGVEAGWRASSVRWGTPGVDANFADRGDLNGDGVVSAADIDQLAAAISGGNSDGRFDLNEDGQVNEQDREYLVRDILRTEFGDSNLDGVFDNADFVDVFTVNGYEDGIEGNSGWADGDWNGDGEFDSEDFVMAFINGGFWTSN